MLLPSKLIPLLQVYICLVEASSVFVNYLDGGETNEIDTDQPPPPRAISRLTRGPPKAHSGPMASPVRAAIASKVLPEVRENNRFSSYDFYDGHKENEILLEPLGFAHLHKYQPGHEKPHGSNSSLDSSPSNLIDPSPSSMDFEAYSITVSPSLVLNANDKDQEELEENFEMHTNNHHSLSSQHQHQHQHQQQSATVLDEQSSTHNSRHYNTAAYQSAKHQQYLSSAMGKYPASLSSFSTNNNLNYIHSLLLTKPSNSAAAAANSLSNLLHGLYSSSSSSSSVPLPPAPQAIPQQQIARPEPSQQQTQNITLVDLSGGSTMCGRQQVAAGSSREPRIVGGNNSYEGEFPWAVSIQRHGSHHCGGVIVGRRWILTAAHCVRSQLVGNLIVRTGGNTLARSQNHLSSHLERDYLVDQIVMHSDFSRYENLTASQMKSSANTNNADIALLRLRHEIRWNELAWPVCFPPREAGNFSGHDAVVIGWGKLNEKSEEFSNELQKVKLTIIDNKVCQNWFRQAGREMPIDDRVICAGYKNGGKDACHGDSGGPLLSKINGHYAVVGVVSTGIGCARPLLPGLYSRVSSYIGWIERHIT